jgi:hypothetical protein
VAAEIVSLLELRLPSGTRYFSSLEGVTHAGKVYEERLLRDGHPQITRSLTHVTYGVVQAEDVRCELQNLDQALSATFRAEARGSLAIVRRLNVADSSVSERFAGVIETATFSGRGTIALELRNREAATLALTCPPLIVDGALIPTATTDVADLGQPIPVVLGVSREHIPARYVEASIVTEPATGAVQERYRYLACSDLTPAAATDIGVCRPFVNTVYLGLGPNLVVIPAGEYDLAWDAALGSQGLLLAPVAGTGGSLAAGTYYYQLTAYLLDGSRYRETLPGSEVSVTVAAGGKVTLSWGGQKPSILNAGPAGYRLYGRTSGSGKQLVATIPGGATFTYVDLGAATTPGTLPTVDTTRLGLHTINFPLIRYGVSQTIAPIFADIEFTEMAPDAATRGLWLFRGDPRDYSANNNWLIDGFYLAFWRFDTALSFLSETGTHPLSGTGFSSAHWVRSRFGQHVLELYSVSRHLFETNPAAFNFGASTSFRVEATVWWDGEAVDEFLVAISPASAESTIIRKRDLTPNSPTVGLGWALKIQRGGAPRFSIGSGGGASLVQATVEGATKLNRAWHHLAGEVDRTAQEIRLYVDGTLEASASCASVGSLASSDDLYVGGDPTGARQFFGRIESIGISSAIGRGDTYVNGKANQGPNALDCRAATARELFIRDDRHAGLDLGTSHFTIEAWIKLTAYGSAANRIAVKVGGSPNTGYEFGVSTSGNLYGTLWRGGSGSATATGATVLALNRWYSVAMVVTREASGVAGSVRLYVDAVDVGEATIPAGAPVSIDNDGLLKVGQFAGNKFQGYLDELRISAVARTEPELYAVWGLGTRNPVQQLRTLLEAYPQTPAFAADTTWLTAIRDVATIENGQLVADGAVVETQPLSEALASLARLRGLRLGINASGSRQWSLSVDKARSVVATFGWKDGVLENIVDRPTWRMTPLGEAAKQSQVKYRPRRRGDGQAIYQLAATPRDVLTVGADKPVEALVPMLRDRTAADIFAGYYAKRLFYGDQGCTFEAGEDALPVMVGDLVTILDPTSGLPAAGETHEVIALEEEGARFTVTTARWDASIFTYTATALPPEPDLETEPDYSHTYPPPVGLVQVTFLGSGSPRRAKVSWIPPNSPNYQEAVVSYREGTLSDNDELIEVQTTADKMLIIDRDFIAATSYVFSVASKNRHGLLGFPAAIEASFT